MFWYLSTLICPIAINSYFAQWKSLVVESEIEQHCLMNFVHEKWNYGILVYLVWLVEIEDCGFKRPRESTGHITWYTKSD